jgi:hypothetical protein
MPLRRGTPPGSREQPSPSSARKRTRSRGSVRRTVRAAWGALAIGALVAAAGPDPASEVAAALDAFHAAAAAADEGRYFSLFAPEGVFLGTAGEERWTVEEFRAYAHPHFAAGRGWTYVARPGRRHIGVSADGGLAWFDEVLDNAKYGECRGTGVLRRIDGAWRIVHYSLTIPIPNEIAPDVVRRIRGGAGGE